MNYDQGWMAFGWLGGLEAGGISAVAAVVLYLVFHAIGQHWGWSDARKIGWSYLVALIATTRMDAWNLFYFNFAQLQSLQLLKAKLAAVHDPDGLGIRVLCELIGIAVGIFLPWAALRLFRADDK
ncbi:MAG: hypothetical protein EPN56_00280 [Rhodanobacter sp.]|nr:MAG: hypothetical protein EPN78_13275 [Rhodanobacter sp.]TAM13945.1 MAG: hypothetical protein EPN66_03385 [Rhodanobacter sp.]TAM37787.1 MAG: hypothetical protein EPN56_00280 [Rhodanobacter sp.]